MQPIKFKFYFLNEQGQPASFLRKKGSFDGETLMLDDARIPAVAIMDVVQRDENMVLVVPTGENQFGHIAFQPGRGAARRLKQALGIARSTAYAQYQREELEKKGLPSHWRQQDCPHCGAAIVLTGQPNTPQVYCRFCDTIFRVDGSEANRSLEPHYRLCDECGMFSKPRKFTIFYFYFLLVVYGFRHGATWRCPGCMKGEAWKMFFGNLPFLLGLPVALVQLLRVYKGNVLDGPYTGLDEANRRALRGDVPGAVAGYRRILERLPVSAGIKHNLGSALLRTQDAPAAAQGFEFALADCANYLPSYHALADCYQRLGKSEELADLHRRFGVEEPAQEVAT